MAEVLTNCYEWQYNIQAGLQQEAVMKKSFFALFVLFVVLATGCVVVPAEQRVYRSLSVPAQLTTVCTQAVWDGEKWVCPSTSQTVVTETVVIDNTLYGVVGGLIAGYWTGNTWHHGVPRGFVVPRHYGYRIAPRGYTVVPRGHAVPRGFYGRRR